MGGEEKGGRQVDREVSAGGCASMLDERQQMPYTGECAGLHERS